jgi:hypothetical protein
MEIRRAFAEGGEMGYRRWVLQQVLKDHRQNQRVLNAASAYAFAGKRKEALQFLWKAYEQRDPRLRWVRAFPEYWSLYGDPEYNRLLKQIGLPETTK